MPGPRDRGPTAKRAVPSKPLGRTAPWRQSQMPVRTPLQPILLVVGQDRAGRGGVDIPVPLAPGPPQLPSLGPGAAPRHRVTLRELLQPQQPGPSCLQLGRHGRRELLGCREVKGRQPGMVGEALSEQVTKRTPKLRRSTRVAAATTAPSRRTKTTTRPSSSRAAADVHGSRTVRGAPVLGEGLLPRQGRTGLRTLQDLDGPGGRQGALTARSRLAGQQRPATGLGEGRQPGVRAELAQQVLDVAPNGVLADEQPLRHGGGAQPRIHQGQHLELPRG